MRTSVLLFGLLAQGVAFAQTNQPQANLSYTFVELRLVDLDTNGGDGFQVNGSVALDRNWIIVGGLSSYDFNNNVDTSIIEIGGGYVWHYAKDWDLLTTLRFVNASTDTPGGDFDDSGIAFSAGARGLLAPKFEVRGFVNYYNVDDSDVSLELAGDYYFTRQFSAGASVEFGGDLDSFSIGARYYFK